jgi:hypothetical protein
MGINPPGGQINSRLAAALAKYPADTWTFEVLQALPGGCSKSDRVRAEQRHIDRLRSWDPAHGFNMNPSDHSIDGPCREAWRHRVIAEQQWAPKAAPTTSTNPES